MTIIVRTKNEIKKCCAKRSPIVDTKGEVRKKIVLHLNSSLCKSLPSISCLEGLLSELCMNHKNKSQVTLNGMICKRKASGCLVNLGKDYETCIYKSTHFTNNRHSSHKSLLSHNPISISRSHNEPKSVNQSLGFFVDAYDDSEPIEF
jgi:hypothetical protein